jgi:flagellar hook assembly protein FlgD
LYQNYPNPFNPSTTIEFTLPQSESVELKVYNILGKEVTTLVSKKLNQGNHTYTFDGTNLASGIYYYQLVAGDHREVKKMILLR